MVQPRTEAKELVEQIGAKLRSVLGLNKNISEEQADAAQQRLKKAVFHGIYSEGQFEKALDQHRYMMRDLGIAIDEVLTEFHKEWKKYKQRGKHRGYANKSLAMAYFKRVISLEERIDAHLRQFERKLDVLSAWRQYKIENDIGSEVNVSEVYNFMSNEFDEFEFSETSFEEQEAEEMIGTLRGSSGAVVSEAEEEMFDQFVEQEFGDDVVTEKDVIDDDQQFETLFDGDESNVRADSESDHIDTVDEEVREFLEEELH